jgi:hypothetical protein
MLHEIHEAPWERKEQVDFIHGRCKGFSFPARAAVKIEALGAMTIVDPLRNKFIGL